MDATTATTAPPNINTTIPGPTVQVPAAFSLATHQNLPAVVAQALNAKTANDPLLLSLVGRIIAGTATLSDSFRYLLLVNQVTLEEFHRVQRQQQSSAMQRAPRRPRTRCRRN